MNKDLLLEKIINEMKEESKSMTETLQNTLRTQYPSIFGTAEGEGNIDFLPAILRKFHDIAISKGYEEELIKDLAFRKYPEVKLEKKKFELSIKSLSELQILDEFVFLNDIFNFYDYDEENKSYLLNQSAPSLLKQYSFYVEEKHVSFLPKKVRLESQDYPFLKLFSNESYEAKRKNGVQSKIHSYTIISTDVFKDILEQAIAILSADQKTFFLNEVSSKAQREQANKGRLDYLLKKIRTSIGARTLVINHNVIFEGDRLAKMQGWKHVPFPWSNGEIHPMRKVMSEKEIAQYGTVESFRALNAIYGDYSEKEGVFVRKRKDSSFDNPDFINALTHQNLEAIFNLPLSFEDEVINKRKGIVLGLLTERERAVINYRFGMGNVNQLSLDDIGKKFGVTRERIRQIESKGIRKAKTAYQNSVPLNGTKIDTKKLKKLFANFKEDQLLLPVLQETPVIDEISPFYEIDDVIDVALNRLSPLEKEMLSYRYGIDDKGVYSIEELSNLLSFSEEETTNILKSALSHLMTIDVVVALQKAESAFIKKYGKEGTLSHINESETKVPLNKLFVAELIAPNKSITIEKDGRIAIRERGRER